MSEKSNMPESAESTSTPAEGPSGTAKTTTPRAKKKRWPITVGVIAAIVVIAGAGMWVWHEQPSFCNAFCHVSMDPYLPTYEAEPGEAALDKWGNEVADASGMMAAVHRADPECNASCMSCHVPTIGEQVAEFGAFVSGRLRCGFCGQQRCGRPAQLLAYRAHAGRSWWRPAAWSRAMSSA